MNKKIFVNEDMLNDYEKENGVVSYKTLVNRIIGDNLVLCNNIENVDPTIFDSVDLYNENDDIYQFYLCNLNEYAIELNKKLGSPLIIGYSEMLDLDVLMVDHFGTGWDYVLTDVEFTTDIKEALRDF